MKFKTISQVFSLILVGLFILMSAMPISAVNDNKWIYDETEYISNATKIYITNLNETVFAGYKTKPQIGVIVIRSLPSEYKNLSDGMDKYKLDMFNQFGVGNSDTNRGVLFIMTLDGEYGWKIGDRYKKGTQVREELEKDFIKDDSTISSLYRSKKYDAIVMKAIKHFEQILANEENGLYIQKDEENQNNQDKIINGLKKIERGVNKFFKLFLVLMLIVLISFIFIGIVVLISKIVCERKMMKKIEPIMNEINEEDALREQFLTENERLINNYICANKYKIKTDDDIITITTFMKSKLLVDHRIIDIGELKDVFDESMRNLCSTK